MRTITLAAAFFLLWHHAQAGTPMRAGGNILKWKDGKVTLRLSRVVHMESGDGGVDRRESAAAVHRAVWDAVRAWTAAGNARVEVDFAFTDQQKAAQGESVVTFTDPAPFDTGLCNRDSFVACTILSYGENGEILSASVAFNPYKKHSVAGFDGTHDVGLIMLHEMGHVFGLDHSAVLDSVLLPQTEIDPGTSPIRQHAIRELASDDLQSLAALYPPEVVAAMEGSVTRDGAPVPGAHVMAVNAEGRVIHGGTTDAGGAFQLVVPPGEYTLAAEPLDGPVFPNQFLSKVEAGEPFASVAAAGAPVTLAEGERRTGLAIEVSGPARVNADSVGLVVGGGYVGTARVTVARGRAHQLALTRVPMSGIGEMSIPAAAAAPAGNPSSPSAAPQLVRQNITVPAAARTGSYLLLYKHPDGSTLLPGGLRVVAGPKPAALLDAATGEPLRRLAAGQRVSITGTDLAVAEAAPPPPYEGAALPCQLAGSAVRVGDRFAPLVSVSPTAIVFEVPAGLPAGDTIVTIVTGTQMESEPVSVVVE